MSTNSNISDDSVSLPTKNVFLLFTRWYFKSRSLRWRFVSFIWKQRNLSCRSRSKHYRNLENSFLNAYDYFFTDAYSTYYCPYILNMTKFVFTYIKNVCLSFIFFFTTFWFVFPSTCIVAVWYILFIWGHTSRSMFTLGESPWSRSRRIRDVVLVVYIDFNPWDLMYFWPKIHEYFPSPGLYPQCVQGFW